MYGDATESELVSQAIAFTRPRNTCRIRGAEDDKPGERPVLTEQSADVLKHAPRSCERDQMSVVSADFEQT